MPDRMGSVRASNSWGTVVTACGECCGIAVDANSSTNKNGKPKVVALDFPFFTLRLYFVLLLPTSQLLTSLETDVRSELEEAVLQHVRRPLPTSGRRGRVRRA